MLNSKQKRLFHFPKIKVYNSANPVYYFQWQVIGAKMKSKREEIDVFLDWNKRMRGDKTNLLTDFHSDWVFSDPKCAEFLFWVANNITRYNWCYRFF